MKSSNSFSVPKWAQLAVCVPDRLILLKGSFLSSPCPPPSSSCSERLLHAASVLWERCRPDWGCTRARAWGWCGGVGAAAEDTVVIGCVAEEAWRSVCVDDDGTNRCGSKVMPIWPRLERRMCQRAPQSLFLLLLLFIISSPEANTKSTRPLTHHDTMQTSSVAMAIPAMMAALQQKANHSWLQQLRPDPQQQKFIPNRTSRQVFSGHFVEVAPMPLPQPSLVIHRRGSRTSPVLLNRLTRVTV